MRDNNLSNHPMRLSSDRHDRTQDKRVQRNVSPTWKYSALIAIAAGAALLPLAAYAQSVSSDATAGPAKSNDHSLTSGESTTKKTHHTSRKTATKKTAPSDTSASPSQPDMKGSGNRNLGGSDAGG